MLYSSAVSTFFGPTHESVLTFDFSVFAQCLVCSAQL